MTEAIESHGRFSKLSSVCPSTLQHVKIFFQVEGHVCNSGSVTSWWQPGGVIHFPQDSGVGLCQAGAV